MNINEKVEKSILLWNQSSPLQYFTGKTVSITQKEDNERFMLKLSHQMKKAHGFLGKNENNGKKLKLQLKQNITSLMRNVFGFSNEELSLIFEHSFEEATRKFVKMARQFDSNISPEDIFQASRNLWIINTLQVMMNEPVDVSPSLFAYSMLYPYTDNYIDDPMVETEEKHAFSHRFNLRLRGVLVNPANTHEERIFSLVDIIENEWDRNKFPEVFDSLLAIHSAQTRSIKLMSKHCSPSKHELLEICIEKGGTSVLADAYLMNGKLNHDMQEFCFNFGVLLQFVDDIQDLQEDMDGKLETAFTCAAKEGELSSYVNRTVDFTSKVMQQIKTFGDEKRECFSGLILKSVKVLIDEAVGANSARFEVDYLKSVENQSVFSFAFIEKYRSKMSQNRVSVMRKLTPFINREIEVA